MWNSEVPTTPISYIYNTGNDMIKLQVQIDGIKPVKQGDWDHSNQDQL